MGSLENIEREVTVVTFGARGTCDKRAAIKYTEFQGVDNLEIEPIAECFETGMAADA
jgi:hypothetical protein